MTFPEKSAWLTVGIVVVAYGWYLTTVIAQLSGGSVSDIVYQPAVVFAAVAVVVLVAVSHIVLATSGEQRSRQGNPGMSAVKRYARSAGGVVISTAAVLGMGLAMVEAEYFWIANVILAGLVVAEVTSAGAQIRVYRRARSA